VSTETYRGVEILVGPGRLVASATHVELGINSLTGKFHYTGEHSRAGTALVSAMDMIDVYLGHHAESVPCPRCHAAVGVRCDPVQWYHSERFARARATFPYGSEAAAILARAAAS